MLNRRVNSQAGLSSAVVALVIGVVSIAGAGVILLNRQAIIDYAAYKSFTPTSEIAKLKDRTGMSDKGELYFYASRPELQSASDFNNDCDKHEDSTAILGCYTGARIYLYDIQNPELDGIREVTAAHEMLHAAYERLGSGEKNRINDLLVAEYEKLKNDSKFAERIAIYDRIEPGQRNNELHSILATEVETIGEELNEHYAKYFNDRGQVVALHKSYSNVFDELDRQADELSAKLTSLAEEIETSKSDYELKAAQLSRDISTFNAGATSGRYRTIDEFYSNRNTLVARSNEVDAMRGSINAKIVQYNQYRDELEKVSVRATNINKSIDSSLAPAPSI